MQDVRNRVHKSVVYNEFESVFINTEDIIDVVNLNILYCRNDGPDLTVYLWTFHIENPFLFYKNSFT